MKTVEELIKLLTLERVDECTYVGGNYKTPWGRVFGGQVLGQSLHAAYQTAPEDRFAHSMHAYFILGGDIHEPIRYEVDTIRDGGSFTTRRVVAWQKGRAIFNMSASFQLRQPGFNHQVSAPNVLPPEVLLPDIEQYKPLKETLPALYKRLTIMHPNAIEFRPVESLEMMQRAEPYRHVWIKTKEKTEVDLPMQHQMLAYASDYNLLTTAARPHLEKVLTQPVSFASLDHAMWFHRDFSMDEWLLYAIDSPSASNSRGFSRGSLFNQSGKLVASVVQEGLMRQMKK